MATSGSVNFSVSRDDLILAAYQHVGTLGEGDTPSSAQTTEAALLLNMIVKARMADGMPAWALKRGYILPFTGASSISLGGSTQAVTSYVTTTTTAATAAAGSTVTLTSVTGISNGYNIGIWCTDNTIQWTTVNGAPAGLVVTLTDALTVGCASGARIFVYQTGNRITKPLRILQVNIENVDTDVSRPINAISSQEYYDLGERTVASTPNQYMVDVQLSTTDFYIYPRMATTDEIFSITFHRPFEDFDASSDTPDFPQEWYLALMLELAVLLGPKAGLSIEERKSNIMLSQYYTGLALSNGTPEQSFYIQPEGRC